MGAGQFPAGGYGGGYYYRAGIDPPYVAAAVAAPPPFRAIKFDPATRTFVQNADGTFADVHPVDQRVALLLWVSRGSIASASSVGNRVRARIARVAIQSIPTIVRAEVSDVLAPLISAGDIQLTRVDVDATAPGRTQYAVFYRNLRDTSDNSIRKVSS